MPKIECNEKLFFQMVGKKYDYNTLEDLLPCAKAELDEKLPAEVKKYIAEHNVQMYIVDAYKIAKELGLGVGISSGANFLGAVLANTDENRTVATVFADDNNRRPICRLKFNSAAHKRISFIDDNKQEISYDIECLDDIFNYRKDILEAAQKYV